ncbi:MAG: tRNA(adenine34) deaminase [Thermosediminibacterales bacterium]|nr:tRNA(adenine34) deaminase [Thermosediminibacterales bacterium]MDK2836053.1 tRNA(adenine34) deaminase [Thermosediminibacterales bacterium]
MFINHDFFMKEALAEAEKAFLKREVPIGAIVVYDGNIIARAHNLRETQKDPTAHAEILAIKEASKTLGGWRLTGCSIYVTIEPCPMCAGAILQARIDRLIFGAFDPKAGVCGTLMNLLQDERFNHRVEVVSGILEKECSEIMKKFFKGLRNAT